MRDKKMDIVVIGGGVIGCTTAYYLTRHPMYDPTQHSITVLEATRIAGGASGKAGGLLAQWAYPTCLVPLSFDLHSALAEEHNGVEKWGYRAIRCGKLTARDRRLNRSTGDDAGLHGLSWAQQLIASWVLLGKRKEVNKDAQNLAAVDGMPEDLDWFQPSCVETYEDIAPESATAQVQPYQFTTAMMRMAEERGATAVLGAAVEEIEYSTMSDVAQHTATEVVFDTAQPPATRRVQAVRYVDKTTGQAKSIPATTVILAAGPWTPRLFPQVPMSALRAHSVTIKPTRDLSAYCLFTEIFLPLAPSEKEELGTEKTTRIACPEIYSRPNHEVYVAGEGDGRVPLPANTDEVEVDKDSCQLIIDAVTGVSDELRDGLVTGRRACYLPTVDLPSGGPLIGFTWTDGLILATGHSCWGIHNAPATGKLVSEMVFEGKAVSADIRTLDPRLVT